MKSVMKSSPTYLIPLLRQGIKVGGTLTVVRRRRGKVREDEGEGVKGVKGMRGKWVKRMMGEILKERGKRVESERQGRKGARGSRTLSHS